MRRAGVGGLDPFQLDALDGVGNAGVLLLELREFAGLLGDHRVELFAEVFEVRNVRFEAGEAFGGVLRHGRKLARRRGDANQILFAAPSCPANTRTMRGRTIVTASIALNLALGAALIVFWRRVPHDQQKLPRPTRAGVSATNPPPRTHVVVRRQFFEWSEIESSDYRAYIANLRDIACPEQTIRDIIVADVNESFERRRLSEIVPDDPPWWKGNPATVVAESITRKEAALDRERRAILNELLGPNWEPSRARPGAMIFLTGPVLGALSTEAKLAVQDIIARGVERERRWQVDNQREMTELERLKLRRETRDELVKVLSPEQLEEYLLRWSFNAAELRRKLAGVDVTPEKFRALFRAMDQADQEQLNFEGADEARRTAARERQAKSLDTLLKQAMGAEKFDQYKLNQDSNWVQTRDLVAKSNIDTNMVSPIYQITRAADEEIERIREAKTLTTAEQEEAIAAAIKDQADSLRELLGEEGYRKYREAKSGGKF